MAEKQSVKIFGLRADEMPIGAYCSPQPAAVADGIKYPSKITFKHYKMLADLGVNIVYGHAEALGRKNERLVFKALDLCEKTGIKYLVRDITAEEYVSLGYREYRDWRTLAADERNDLDGRFKADILRVCNHPAFAGIAFYDEPGLDSFEGIAAAKKIFDEVCPDRLFYVNMLPNNIDARQLQYGACIAGVPDSTEDKISTRYTNDKRYEYFLTKYMETVRPELFSYDSYPFLTLGGVESMHHVSLYELQQLAGWAEQKYGVPYWLFMQIGGKWEGSDTRAVDDAEMRLQFNLSLAYGAKGLQLFPTCFPNDWLSDDVVRAGVIDRYGNPTEFYYSVKLALKQVKACQKYFMQAERRGALLIGEFNGLLPPEEQLEKIAWNETIFRGKLPEFANPSMERAEPITGAQATSQFFIGVFDIGGRRMLYAVNNSIVTAANLKLKFDKTYNFKTVYRGEETERCADGLYVQRVAAGDGVLVVF